MPLSEVYAPEDAGAEEFLSAAARQLEALTALAAAPNDARELEEVLSGLADTITRLTDYRTCFVALFTDEAPFRPRVLSYSSNIPREYAAQISAGSYPRAAVARLIARGVRVEVGGLGFAAYYPPSHYAELDAVFPDRYKTDAPLYDPGLGAQRWREGDELFVPLAAHDGGLLGLISLDDPRSGRAPDPRSVLPALAFARQTAQLVERRRDAERLTEQAEREALVNRITRAVRRTLDAAEVFRAATDELGLHLGVDRCVLFVLDREAGVVRGAAEYAAPGILPAGRVYELPLVEGLVERVREHGVVAFSDVDSDPAVRRLYETILKGLGTRSIMFAGIRVGEEVQAVFALSTVRERRHWRASDLALAQAVADQTGIAIRQAELFEMVERAKRAWEATFDAMSDGVFIFTNERRLARVNRAGASLEARSPHEILGRRCCDILRASGGEGCVVERAVAAGLPVTVEYRPEALGRPLLVTAEPVFDEGTQVGAVCTVRDLSELRRVEAVARESQTLLTHILESAREAIYAIDTEGRLQWCNPALGQATGLAPGEMIGRRLLDLTHEADRDHVRERFRRALAGEPQNYEMRYVTRAGQVRYALVDDAPLVVDGRTTGVLGIARDVTEQKQERERAAQADKLRALGQLASGVAHDFNNSLAAILGRAQLLRRATRDPETARSLDIIQTAAEDAAATVRRIRSFAHQAPGERRGRLDIAALLRDAVEITRTRWENDARARGLAYDVRVESECEALARGSASELREVFVNLIVNAIDAMPAGGRLDIRCRRSGERLELLFTDTGEGMGEEVRARIFEPFYTTKGAQGTGLGLFVSYGIIERHGGQITVESERGAGTTFRISLPRAESPSAAHGAGPQAPVSAAGSLSVLVVDDEEQVRETLAEMVKALGHRAVTADGGRAALEALDGSEFDLVFTDLSMPGMDGWEVARAVRARRPATRVVVVTGYGAEAARSAEAAASSVAAVIAKPFDFRRIQEALKTVMSDE
jgi:PAS domain S-box-containing protein